MKRVYLDAAAATPVDKRVIEAMLPYLADKFENPSALYEGARKVKSDLDEIRARVSKLIGSKPSEIIFTAGGTESTNLAIKGVMESNPDSNIVLSAVEHDAVRKPASKFKNHVAKVDEFGIVDLDDLRSKIDDNTAIVSIMMVNNEVGSIQPIKDVSEIVGKVRKARKLSGNKTPLYLHVDACQAPLYLDVNVARLGVDLMSLNGSKMHGPKQSGILYIRAGVVLSPDIVGGGQEFGYRSGTENVAFAAGFARALELADRGRSERAKNVSELRDKFIEQLETRFDAVLNGHRKHRVAHNVHVTFNGADNERLIFALDDLGVDVASGSACSASSEESSHVLKAMGRTDEEARASLRISLLKTTTESDIEFALDQIEKALKA